MRLKADANANGKFSLQMCRIKNKTLTETGVLTWSFSEFQAELGAGFWPAAPGEVHLAPPHPPCADAR